MSFKLIMPMAGNGSRFYHKGYKQPKPLIDVNNKPMFVHSIESLNIKFDEYIFITKKDHNCKSIIQNYYEHAKILELDSTTEGAACTVLLADQYINDDDSVFITNCDQMIEYNVNNFLKNKQEDGIIFLFKDDTKNPKWSFADYNEKTFLIDKVAEKNPISNWATSGQYYWKNWKIFKESALNMINNNDRVNEEFYLCPVYNYTINSMQKTVKGVVIDKMIGLGTPEDLELYLNNK